MDSKVIDFLTEIGKPCKALRIAKAVGKTTVKEVNPTLYKLEREKRVERKGNVEGGQTPLWGLVQGGNSDQEPSPSQGHHSVDRPHSSAQKSTPYREANALVRHAEEAVDGIADDMSRLSVTSWKEALRKHHQELRTGILVKNILPELYMLPLKEIEYSRIKDEADNVSQVDELIAILCTKTKAHFDQFCSVLDSNGYGHWTKRLRGEDNGDQATPPEHPVTDDQTMPQTGRVVGTDEQKIQGVEKPRQGKKEKVNIQFVFITANKNEYHSLMSFLNHPKWKLQYPVETTCDDIDELKGRIEMKDKFNDYRLFNVRCDRGTVNCAVMKCLSMGSSGRSGSKMETLKFLITARDEQWSPKAIFIIGCCGGGNAPEPAGGMKEKKKRKVPESEADAVVGRKESVVGCVCIASKVVHYNRGKIVGEGEMNWLPTTDYGSEDTTWCDHVLKEEDMEHHTKEVPYKKIDRFLSGDYVVKSEETAAVLWKHLADKSIAAIEMEGLGVAEALEVAKLINVQVIRDEHKIPMPEYVIVKGISDLAGSDKNSECDIKFFGKTMKNIEEDHRQQMCTIMAATVVLRAIVAYT